MEGYTLIGHTTKAIGIQGHLILHIEAQYLDALNNAEALFLFTEGQLVPFFIETLALEQDIEVLFEDVKTPEAAKLLAKTAVYLPSTTLPEPDLTRTGLAQLSGFLLEDTTSGWQGAIRAVEQYPQQLMAILERDGKDILVPLAEDWILELDTDNQRIKMNLPEGLLDL